MGLSAKRQIKDARIFVQPKRDEVRSQEIQRPVESNVVNTTNVNRADKLFKDMLKNFQDKNSGKAVKVIFEIMKHLKFNGLTKYQAIEIIEELNGYTKMTIEEIASKCQYTIKTIGGKNYKYFLQICRSTASEPKIYRTMNIPLNLPKGYKK